jgi:hypothetical protein
MQHSIEACCLIKRERCLRRVRIEGFIPDCGVRARRAKKCDPIRKNRQQRLVHGAEPIFLDVTLTNRFDSESRKQSVQFFRTTLGASRRTRQSKYRGSGVGGCV